MKIPPRAALLGQQFASRLKFLVNCGIAAGCPAFLAAGRSWGSRSFRGTRARRTCRGLVGWQIWRFSFQDRPAWGDSGRSAGPRRPSSPAKTVRQHPLDLRLPLGLPVLFTGPCKMHDGRDDNRKNRGRRGPLARKFPIPHVLPDRSRRRRRGKREERPALPRLAGAVWIGIGGPRSRPRNPPVRKRDGQDRQVDGRYRGRNACGDRSDRTKSRAAGGCPKAAESGAGTTGNPGGGHAPCPRAGVLAPPSSAVLPTKPATGHSRSASGVSRHGFRARGAAWDCRGRRARAYLPAAPRVPAAHSAAFCSARDNGRPAASAGAPQDAQRAAGPAPAL